MDNKFVMETGTYGFRLSNPSILNLVCLFSSLSIYNLPNAFEQFFEKQRRLAVYLQALIEETIDKDKVSIISPKEVEHRGCQLSLEIKNANVDEVYNKLVSKAVVVDLRRPDCIRVAPYPFINSFMDVFDFVEALKSSIK